MSLVNPEKKMSKSDSNTKSRILITDSSTVIHKKIKAALTDSIDSITFDQTARPGLGNLLQILFYLESHSGTINDLAADMENMSKSAVKDRVASAIDQHLTPIREKYEEIINANSGKMLDDIAKEGAIKATASTELTMRKVREAVGL
jgi:tryptophanyl-tRNA synthetase